MGGTNSPERLWKKPPRALNTAASEIDNEIISLL